MGYLDQERQGEHHRSDGVRASNEQEIDDAARTKFRQPPRHARQRKPALQTNRGQTSKLEYSSFEV